MNWEAIGAVGDALGGVGVFVTLVYLTIQTRQNTRAIRAATYSQVVDSFSSISLALFHDPEAAALIRRVSEDPESLSPDEFTRYGYFLLSYLRCAENMYFQSEQGILDAATWRGIRESIFSALSPEPAVRWWRVSGRLFNPTFQRFVEEGIVNHPSSPSLSEVLRGAEATR